MTENDAENVPVIKMWLEWEGMQCRGILITVGYKLCECLKGLFDTLSGKFMPQHSQRVLSLQYCKIIKTQMNRRMDGQTKNKSIGM